MKKLVTLLLALVATTALWAEDFEVDGIYSNILEDKINEVEVTYKGIGAFAVRDEYTDTVVIPSTVTYKGIIYNVTKIGNDAFRSCYSLESVIIPNSVTEILGYAFAECSSLRTVTLSEGLSTIEYGVFRNCRSLESMTIPGDVDDIQRDAFKNCRSLDTVMVSGKVVWYKNYAWENGETDIFFEDCTKLYICKKAFPSRTKVVSVK